MISPEQKLLLAAKVIVSDMDAIARLQVDAPVFFGMGQALNRVYCILRGIPFEQIPKIVPLEMMKWVRDQRIEGIKEGENSESMLKKGLIH